MIYLDHNATTPLLPEAMEAMRPLMTEAFGNPSSSHAAGRRARQSLEDARETVANCLGALPEEVIFTSGATEANNLAIFGLCGELPGSQTAATTPFVAGLCEAGALPGSQTPATRPGATTPFVAGLCEAGALPGSQTPATRPGALYSTVMEHLCVVEPLKQLANKGYSVTWLPVNARGIVAAFPVPRTARLVCLQLANHETGAIQPVAAFVNCGVPVHCDAAQAVGKIPVSFRAIGVTAMSLSAHKFRGPKGIGALLVKKGTKLQPRAFGGHQQRGHRPGTEPVPLAVGMAVALQHAVRTMTDTALALAQLRLRFLAKLKDAAVPFVVNGPLPGDADSLPTTLNVSFPGCRADILLMALDLVGVACSTGSACSSGSLLPSPVLTAMGVPDDVLQSAMRFSFGETTTTADVDAATERIAKCVSFRH